MTIRVLRGQVTVTRSGVRGVVPPGIPFDFTKEELQTITRFDPNIARKPTDTEVKGVTKFAELKGNKPVGKPAVPVNTQAVETAPTVSPQPNAGEGVHVAKVYAEAELNEMTVAQLKELAKARNVELTPNANKDVVIEDILKAQAGDDATDEL